MLDVNYIAGDLMVTMLTLTMWGFEVKLVKLRLRLVSMLAGKMVLKIGYRLRLWLV